MPKQQHTSDLLNNAQKRVHVAVSLSATALFLSACFPSANTSPSPSTTAISHSNAAPADSQPIDEDASTATSSSGNTDDSPLADYIPELGTPDPTDPNFELFEPCSEIPAEVFAAAGLHDMNSTTITGLGTACGQKLEEVSGVFINFGMFSATREQIEDETIPAKAKTKPAIEGIFNFVFHDEPSGNCHSAIETVEGTFTATAALTGSGTSDPELCDITNKKIETLLKGEN